MTTEISLSALESLPKTGVRLSLLMDPPSPTLLIDGDDLIVTNMLDRTDNPAVLITGNNNIFINHSGATLTGTGASTDSFTAEAAVEISGIGNTVENQAGATITGNIGVFSSAANTSVVNDGTILSRDAGSPGFEDSAGVQVEADSSVANRGLIRADATSDATAISTEDRTIVDNAGTVEAAGRLASGISVGEDSTVVTSGVLRVQGVERGAGVTAGDRTTVQNDGAVEVSARSAIGVQLGADSSIANHGELQLSTSDFGTAVSVGADSSIENFGIVRVDHDGVRGNVFGLGGGANGSVWNGGTVAVSAAGEGSATGVVAVGGRFDNGGTVSAVASGPSPSSQSVGAFLLSAATGSNSGTLSASSVAGTAVGLIVADHAPFSNSGLVSATGARAIAVALADQGTISNAGTIEAGGTSASGVLANSSATIANDGLISAVSDVTGQPSIGVDFDTTTAAQKAVVNTGTIVADIAIRDSVAAPIANGDLLTIDNSGVIDGAVDLGNGVDLVTNTGTIIGDLDLGADNDVFDGRGGLVDGAVLGGEGDDILRGGDGDDILVGGAGSDVIAGGAGADVMIGGDPGGPVDFSIDTLDYSDSPESVQVNLGDATQSTSAPVKGEAGTGFGGHAEGDTFQGFRKVIGSAFDDFVYGADGGSIVELGDGNDTFDNDATLFTEDLVDLGAGNDVARTGAGDDFVDGGAGNDLLQGEDGFDFLQGGDGNDLLFGGADGDLLDGGAGRDILYGGSGDDLLDGGAGRDILLGGSGDDLLDGGAGDDVLVGGHGDDLFGFGPDGGNDRILDFNAGVGSADVVDLRAFDTILSFDDVLGIASQIGGDDDDDGGVATVLTFDTATTLTFDGVRLADINEADFIFV